MSRGQASIEFMGVVILGLAFIIIVGLVATTTFREQSFNAGLTQARSSADALASAATTLCSGPASASTEVLATVPAIVNLTGSSFANKTVKFELISGDRREYVYSTVRCDINGTMPPRAGRYAFVLTRVGTTVQINYNVTVQ